MIKTNDCRKPIVKVEQVGGGRRVSKEEWEKRPLNSPVYNKEEVDKAIKRSGRYGKKIGKKESTAIHRLLKDKATSLNKPQTWDEITGWIDERELLEYWRMSRDYASKRYDRMKWTVDNYHKRLPDLKSITIYKTLDRLLMGSDDRTFR